jgi:hypothetical protein
LVLVQSIHIKLAIKMVISNDVWGIAREEEESIVYSISFKFVGALGLRSTGETDPQTKSMGLA